MPQLALSAVSAPAEICHWPEARPFALFLSHDVDQIHDRELFRILADANHIRRRLTQGEPGNVLLAASRMARSFVWPKQAEKDFETLLAIEGRHGFRSTFFLLHDKYWARHGSRYSFNCREIHRIVRRIKDAGGELGVHGGYYRFNDAALYRESMEAVEAEFGVHPCGIRNHLLRFSYPETWCAQAEAGFAYDATYGLPHELGPRGGWPFPFQACDSETGTLLDLIELPITVMDVTLFRYLRLGAPAALEVAWEAIQKVIVMGGLISLLWHNNYFNEPEYAGWQHVYEELLNRLALLRPWCATGAEINSWWRARSAVTLRSLPFTGRTFFKIDSQRAITNLVLEVDSTGKIQVQHAAAFVRRIEDKTRIQFPNLRAGETVSIKIEG